MNKANMLRKMLVESSPIVLAGAHNGISARLVEEAGFDAVWASGFEISGAHAVP
ncbi:MAG: isocitrate lyase/phosphoenolpyruvate mutase family protein, partial [Pyrinomonadaceae bacterium]|nr:isocitrate lyase/phosphoenolpyruvate mutase family protein [Pyrinomonadaceae bacterium]